MAHPQNNRENFLANIRANFNVAPGSPLPLGVTVRRGGLNFAVVSRHARSVLLVIFAPGAEEPLLELPLDPRHHRTGDVWHAFIRGLDPGIEYGYRVLRRNAPPGPDSRAAESPVLLDPYTLALSGGERWGEFAPPARAGGTTLLRPRHSLVVEDHTDGDTGTHPNHHPADAIIYELHVRGFTRHPSSGVAHPGTYRGIAEKIPYLQELGITTVELMPVTEFEECENPRVRPDTGERLRNFWGYNPLAFFAPKAAYAVDGARGRQVREFKEMVQALHAAGIEVMLDMVFNHTAEGDRHGPTVSFRGLDDEIYYLRDPATGEYSNYAGCGNTLNCNHPVVRQMILDCLRYWATEMRVDGFRFDLASVLGRGRDGQALANPPLLEHIAGDPVLAHTKLIAEAWDAAGLYQVGSFPHWGRWAEWNGRFRDDLRRFVKSDAGMVSAVATRLAGSPDLYQVGGRACYHSINFITCHDGFTLWDLVSHDRKHNEANGEGNTDGADENYSWNCGEEGPSASAEINALRRRQVRNMAALLLLAHGVPMILAGDEFGRSQSGNNNAYCQDNPMTWLDWSLRERNADLFRFFRLLIRFRRNHPLLRGAHLKGTDHSHTPALEWHGVRAGQPDWSWESRCLAASLGGNARDEDIYLAANMHWESHRFELPPASSARRWHRVVDTGLPAPEDIVEEAEAPELSDPAAYPVGPRSVVVLVGR